MSDSPILSWKVAGLLLGILLIIATALVKPLGVSTEYVVTDAVVLHKAFPQAIEANSYLNKYGEKDDWGVGYGWMLVLGMFIGGGISAAVTRKLRQKENFAIPPMWKESFGNAPPKRYLQAFIGGVLLLFGARLAGGCTSGHMISGISQLTIGSFIFGISIFASGILTAKTLYRKGGAS